MRPIRAVKAYGAAAAQSVRTEILQAENAEWAKAEADEVIVLELVGMFGAVTATLGIQRGSEIIVPEGSALDATTFGNDWSKVAKLDLVLLPGQKLYAYVIDSAADPLGVTFAVKGAAFKVGEL